MSDEIDLLIERSREIRAQADFLTAWSEAVRETSRYILAERLTRALCFAVRPSTRDTGPAALDRVTGAKTAAATHANQGFNERSPARRGRKNG